MWMCCGGRILGHDPKWDMQMLWRRRAPVVISVVVTQLLMHGRILVTAPNVIRHEVLSGSPNVVGSRCTHDTICDMPWSHL